MVIPQVGDVTPVGFTKAGKTLAKLIAKKGQHVSIDRLLWAGNGDFVTELFRLMPKVIAIISST